MHQLESIVSETCEKHEHWQRFQAEHKDQHEELQAKIRSAEETADRSHVMHEQWQALHVEHREHTARIESRMCHLEKRVRSQSDRFSPGHVR